MSRAVDSEAFCPEGATTWETKHNTGTPGYEARPRLLPRLASRLSLVLLLNLCGAAPSPSRAASPAS